jgi:hypothetical protein
MAGRIRSIKPEILEDERSAGLSSDAWRLWVSMWLLADDHGRLRGTPEWLRSQVFWATPHKVNVSDLLVELDAAGVIVRYVVSDQKYIEIPNWTKHQKVDHPAKPRIPASCEDSSRGSRRIPETLARLPEDLASISENLATDQDLRSGPPTSDQDQYRSLSASADLVLAPRLELGKAASAAQRKTVDRHLALAVVVLDSLNAARKATIPGARDIKPSYSSLSAICGRLDAGKTMAECLAVVAVCEAEVRTSNASWPLMD